MNYQCECGHRPDQHFNNVGPCEHFTDPTFCSCPFFVIWQGDDD